jgi:hypothetical protein
MFGNTKQKKNYNKDCNFIILHDKMLFKDLQMPSNATNFMLWYKKTEPQIWGLTIKQVTSGEQFDSQHVWKSVWFYHDGKLVPTNSSTSLNVGCVEGELFLRLSNILTDNLKK